MIKVTGKRSGTDCPCVTFSPTAQEHPVRHIDLTSGLWKSLFSLPCFLQVAGAFSTQNPQQQGWKGTWVRLHLSLLCSSTFLTRTCSQCEQSWGYPTTPTCIAKPPFFILSVILNCMNEFGPLRTHNYCCDDSTSSRSSLTICVTTLYFQPFPDIDKLIVAMEISHSSVHCRLNFFNKSFNEKIFPACK